MLPLGSIRSGSILFHNRFVALCFLSEEELDTGFAGRYRAKRPVQTKKINRALRLNLRPCVAASRWLVASTGAGDLRSCMYVYEEQSNTALTHNFCLYRDHAEGHAVGPT